MMKKTILWLVMFGICTTALGVNVMAELPTDSWEYAECGDVPLATYLEQNNTEVSQEENTSSQTGTEETTAQNNEYAAETTGGSTNSNVQQSSAQNTGTVNSASVTTETDVDSEANDVKVLQGILIALGYSCGDSGADGDYGTETVNAVKSFQKENSLTSNGTFDEATKEKLFEVYREKLSDDDSIIKSGKKGAEVKLMQAMLTKCGYLCGTSGADGEFGAATVSALKKFQSEHDLTEYGIYESDTRIKLFELYITK